MLIKSLPKLAIQTVKEHCTASTDHPCEFLNGCGTVQQENRINSTQKPSFSKLEAWKLRLDSRVTKLKAFKLQDARIES